LLAFRKNNDPSFSIYDCGCRFKDHARDNVRGDSFDFYQLATRQNASEAFVDFIELVGLGAELKRPSNGTKCRSSAAAASAEAEETAPKSVRSAADIAKKLGIYYDPERACYWSVDSRENWIKINETSVARHLAARGYRSTKRTGETVSVVDRIINEIQCSMNVEYAGSLAGYQKGLREYSGKRLLIVDSPCLIEPRQGDWSTVRDFLNTLLDAENTDQIVYFHGWLKTALLALHAQKPRPGQALVLAGKRDCGKSLLQSLATELFGGGQWCAWSVPGIPRELLCSLRPWSGRAQHRSGLPRTRGVNQVFKRFPETRD
jgi:hypothetical protein